MMLSDKLEFGGESPLTMRECYTGNAPKFLPDTKHSVSYRVIKLDFAGRIDTNFPPGHPGKLEFDKDVFL